MKKQTASTPTVTPDKTEQLAHHSDGSELIPSEINPNLPSEKIMVLGYTMDDEGIINNYALEPEISEATYPTPQQQVRYIWMGISAIAFVTFILLIAFAVS